jgi:zinc transporter ZupT
LYVSGSVVMGAAVFFVKQVFQTPLLQLCAGTAAGIMLYAGVLLLFKDSLLIDTAIAGIAKIRNLYRQQITDQIEL